MVQQSDECSLLAELEDLSECVGDGGLFHGGHVLYIQSRADDFILKAEG